MNDKQARLAAPFPPDVIGWKAQTVKGERALAVAYIDARDVMDRLDAVLGVEGWQDAYTVLADGNVVCRLALHIGKDWIAKEDVGSESEQQDEGDKRKASFSDAFKRVAVKFGIGRYLYRLPAQWVDYDPQKKQLRGTPVLPVWALPGKPTSASPPPAAAAPTAITTPPRPSSRDLPANGAELAARIEAFELRLVEVGLCSAGDLLAAIGDAARLKDWPDAWKDFTSEQIKAAMEHARAYEKQQRAIAVKRKQKEPERVG